MKNILLTILRNKNTKTAEFRKTAQNLSSVIATEAAELIKKKKVGINTPITKTAGSQFEEKVILVPILRAGLAMLPAFLNYFEDAPVGFFGLKRNEKTAIANIYYQNIPKITKGDKIIILDPMLATGGSAEIAINLLLKTGAKEENIIFCGIISAKEGVNKIKKGFPKIKIIIAATDPKLNKQKYIVPGLGDFGDRYFKT